MRRVYGVLLIGVICVLSVWMMGQTFGLLIFEEGDASPSVVGVSKVIVSNGTLTDDGGGQVTLTTGGAGGGDAVHLTGVDDPNIATTELCSNIGKDRYTETPLNMEWYCSATDTWTRMQPAKIYVSYNGVESVTKGAWRLLAASTGVVEYTSGTPDFTFADPVVTITRAMDAKVELSCGINWAASNKTHTTGLSITAADPVASLQRLTGLVSAGDNRSILIEDVQSFSATNTLQPSLKVSDSVIAPVTTTLTNCVMSIEEVQ